MPDELLTNPPFTVEDLIRKHPLNQKIAGEVYKFIKVGGKYRFGHSFLAHGTLLKAEESIEAVEAGGTLRLAPAYWTITDWQSSSLNVRCGEKEVEELTTFFGRPENKPF